VEYSTTFSSGPIADGKVACAVDDVDGDLLLEVIVGWRGETLVIDTDVTVAAPPPPAETSAGSLARAHPNPFKPRTTIDFVLGAPGETRLEIYDVSGALVRRLVNERLEVGGHEVAWDGRDEAGRSVSAGVYFYRLRVNGRVVGVERTVRLN
jgi:hypothetical protein